MGTREAKGDRICEGGVWLIWVDAAKREYEISRTTITRWIREGRLTVYRRRTGGPGQPRLYLVEEQFRRVRARDLEGRFEVLAVRAPGQDY